MNHNKYTLARYFVLSFALAITATTQLQAHPTASSFLLYTETEATKHLVTEADRTAYTNAQAKFQADLDAFNHGAKDALEVQYGWRQYMADIFDIPMSTSPGHDRMRFEDAAKLNAKNKALYELYMHYLKALEHVGGTIEKERGEITTH